MTAVFIKILNMSLTAGYCIVAVIALRFLLRKQAKILSYLLWSVVLFRLLCPFSVTSSYSLLPMDTSVVPQESLAGAGETTGTVWHGKGYIFDETTQTSAVEAEPFAPSAEAGEGEQAAGWQRAILIGAWIWLAGIAALLGYSLWTALRFGHFLAEAVPVSEGYYEVEGISTPFVFGIIRPKIYLPSHLQPEERRYVLEHERVHVARKDYLIKLLSWGAVCLHWFNPLVWLAFVLMERDMEMSCDEAVLRRLGGEAKQAYSLTLLQLSSGEKGVGSSPIAFGEGNVKSRIQNILGWHKRRIVTVVSLAVLMGILVFGLALNPADRAQKEAEEQLLLGFVHAYANAYCEQDGNTLVEMYANESLAYESLPLLDQDDGVYTFGYSSPWPNEFRFVLGEGETEEESRAEIWYYAWTSDPHVTVWKEDIRIVRYQVTGSALRFLDSISTKAEFEEAYLIGGKYQFTDYVERGFVEGINAQTAYDRENGGADRNAAFRNPDTAAAWIFNLEGGQCETLSNVSGKQAVVSYTFADGSRVEIPMYNAKYEGITIASDNADAQTGIVDDIWLPDLHVWNAKVYL